MGSRSCYALVGFLVVGCSVAACTEQELTCEANRNCPDDYLCIDGTCQFRTEELAFGPPCPEGCVGDLVRDFKFEQGGKTGVWRFLDDGRNNTWAEMQLGEIDDVVYFVGQPPDPRPLLLYCPAYTDEDVCEGRENRILVTPSRADAGYRDPVIAFIAPADGTYRLVGDYDKTGEGPVELILRRNVRDDEIARISVAAATTSGELDETVELLAGDRLLFTVKAGGSGDPPTLGFHLYVLDANDFPGACQLAIRFEEQKAEDACGGITYTARTADGDTGGYVDTTLYPVTGALPETGYGLHIGQGDYLLPEGVALDYSGGFTIQMWVKVPAFTWSTLYADWDSAVPGGVNISSSSGGSFDANVLTGEETAVSVSWQWPDDWDWHFLRVVRDPEGATFRVCVDGDAVAGSALDGALNVSPALPPFLGRNVTYNPPYFLGDFDDVRVYARALPCGT